MSAASNAGRIGVWGSSGSGKSSYVKALLQAKKRVVIFDTEDEYEGGVFVDRNPDGVRRAMRANYFGFVVRYFPRPGKEAKHLSAICKGLLAAQERYKKTEGREGAPITLVVEEMNKSFPVHGGAANCPGFAEVCSRGRKYGIEVIGVSQRPAEVDMRFRGNLSESVCFRLDENNDKKAVASRMGKRPADLPTENLRFLKASLGQITEGKMTFPRNRPKIS